jgi:light-regulated signal transduction histidine kinase (bacteriophytochrome)
MACVAARTKTHREDTGLGDEARLEHHRDDQVFHLALSRKFIELHGGKIWVKSQVEAWSTFTFSVPVRRGE